MTYTWTTGAEDWDLDLALSGALVGFPNDDPTKTYDISKTGRLTSSGTVIIAGITLWVDDLGRVTKTIPDSIWNPVTTGEGSEAVTTYSQLRIVTTEMGDESAVGGQATRTRGSTTPGGEVSEVTITSMEPRDHFAIRVLQTMLRNVDHPEAIDDASMLMYSYAAYKWAQAMVLAMADSRNTDAESGGGEPSGSVNPDDLQTNTDKLLYDMSQLLKEGVAIKGSGENADPPVRIEGQAMDVNETIHIVASVVDKKYVKFVFSEACAMSDISVYVEMTCKIGATTGVSRSAGFVIPKCSPVFVGSVDPDIDEITALVANANSPKVRGTGSSYDVNIYEISLAP